MGGGADAFLGLSVNEFLDRMAARAPTPGGGAAAALAGALASAVGRMVAAYSAGKQADPTGESHVARLCEELERADRVLRGLVGEDAAAYEQLSRATRASQADPKRTEEMRHALTIALTVPLEIAAVASGAAGVLKELRPLANRHLLADLGVAIVLAEACVQAAAYCVRVNAAQMPEEAQRRHVLREIAGIVRHASETRRVIEALLPRDLRL
jgi:formiminotetrahydrofolate cyclodeaminase